MNEAQIRNICSESILYADWTVKFKPTYKHSESASLRYDEAQKKITVLMDGTAENAYGVPDDIMSIISFDTKGKMILNKDGVPDIY